MELLRLSAACLGNVVSGPATVMSPSTTLFLRCLVGTRGVRQGI